MGKQAIRVAARRPIGCRQWRRIAAWGRQVTSDLLVEQIGSARRLEPGRGGHGGTQGSHVGSGLVHRRASNV
jgi:hypothetical protein